MVVTNTGRIIGGILGVIIGMLFVAAPIMGYVRQEAAFNDPTSRLISFGFAILGIFMIIGAIIQLSKKPDSAVAVATSVPAAAVTTTQSSPKEEPEIEEKQVKCRFCKKLYSAEYNGCPYCKKK